LKEWINVFTGVSSLKRNKLYAPDTIAFEFRRSETIDDELSIFEIKEEHLSQRYLFSSSRGLSQLRQIGGRTKSRIPRKNFVK
jgi:hypothetical protein